MAYSVFHAETGEILRFDHSNASPSDMAAQSLAAHEIIIDGAWDDLKFYVLDGEAVPRPVIAPPASATIAADDTDLLVISGIPADTGFRLSGPGGVLAEGVIEDGAFEWSTALAGDYRISLHPPFPWRDFDLGVTAA